MMGSAWPTNSESVIRSTLLRYYRLADACEEVGRLLGRVVTVGSLRLFLQRKNLRPSDLLAPPPYRPNGSRPLPRGPIATDDEIPVEWADVPPDPPTEPELPRDDLPPVPPVIHHDPQRNLVRVIVPDSHGAHIDTEAREAFLGDLKALSPDEIVFLGDHIDCAGTFSVHQRSYTNEMAESYSDDVGACNSFLDRIQMAAPRAVGYYLEGNHEAHVERWAARMFESQKDAESYLERQGPAAVLQLAKRGIGYYRRSEHYDGISIPGAIRLGKCYFVHGISHARNAAQVHLARFGASVVFGHIHRSQSTIERTVTSDGIGAWCPGTLAKLQPLYRHTSPSDWSHGYAVQFVNASGHFLHVNVPILGGVSMLMDVARRLS